MDSEALTDIAREHAAQAGDDSRPGTAGDLVAIPAARHSLEVDEDSVVLLTVARRP